MLNLYLTISIVTWQIRSTAENVKTLMGKQSNKVEKRKRRTSYLKRKNAAVKSKFPPKTKAWTSLIPKSHPIGWLFRFVLSESFFCEGVFWNGWRLLFGWFGKFFTTQNSTLLKLWINSCHRRTRLLLSLNNSILIKKTQVNILVNKLWVRFHCWDRIFWYCVYSS